MRGVTHHLARQPSDALSLLRKSISENTHTYGLGVATPKGNHDGCWSVDRVSSYEEAQIRRGNENGSQAVAERSKIQEKPLTSRDTHAHTEQLCIINKSLICL